MEQIHETNQESDSDGEHSQQAKKTDEDPFEFYIPKRKDKDLSPGKIQLCTKSLEVEEKCNSMMKEILSTHMKQVVRQIFDLIVNANDGNSKVIAVHFKRNQVRDLRQFSNLLHNKISEKAEVRSMRREDVKDIALDVFISENQAAQKEQEDSGTSKKQGLRVYLNRRITNLSKKNLYVFEKTVIDKNFTVILPTYESMGLTDGHGISRESEKMFFEIYNSKDLFCEFVYRCLKKDKIMGYVPREALELIDDFKYYPISYHQGCRRFVYAIQIYDKVCEMQKKQKKEYVQFSKLFDAYRQNWGSFLDLISRKFNARSHYEKISKCILDKSYVLKVNQNLLDNILAFDKGIRGEQHFFEEFLKIMRQRLLDNPELKHLAPYLDSQQNSKSMNRVTHPKKKTGRDRADNFLPAKGDNRNPKAIFEDKITKMFHVATQSIREQANQVSWEATGFTRRIKPQFMKEVVDSILEQEEYRDIFNSIRSYISVPLAKIIHDYDRYSVGKIVYVVRILEIKGLIEISKNSFKPMLSTNYFEKSYYAIDERQ